MKKLSKRFYEQIKPLEKKYLTKQALTLPALHLAQSEWGWLPSEILEEVAQYLEIPVAQLVETASFYQGFYLKPMGKKILKFCNNLSCYLKGSEELLKHAEKKLKIPCGFTTPDEEWTLLEEECVGACDVAPVVLVNETYYEKMSVDALNSLLEKREKA